MKTFILSLAVPIAALATLTAQSPPPQEPPQLLEVASGEMLLVWQGHIGRSYFMQVSDPSDHLRKWIWAPVIEGGNDEEISYEVDVSAERGFFRIRHTDQVPGDGETLDTADFDADGISNKDEIEPPVGPPTNPLNPDTDFDGLPEGWERAHGLDPTDDGSINPQNGANGLFQGGPSTNAEAYAQGVTASPSATIDDLDGDGIPNEIDAAPLDFAIIWKRSPESTYAWIPVDLPVGFKPNVVNNHLDVLGSLLDRDDPDQKFVIKGIDGSESIIPADFPNPPAHVRGDPAQLEITERSGGAFFSDARDIIVSGRGYNVDSDSQIDSVSMFYSGPRQVWELIGRPNSLDISTSGYTSPEHESDYPDWFIGNGDVLAMAANGRILMKTRNLTLYHEDEIFSYNEQSYENRIDPNRQILRCDIVEGGQAMINWYDRETQYFHTSIWDGGGLIPLPYTPGNPMEYYGADMAHCPNGQLWVIGNNNGWVKQNEASDSWVEAKSLKFRFPSNPYYGDVRINNRGEVIGANHIWRNSQIHSLLDLTPSLMDLQAADLKVIDVNETGAILAEYTNGDGKKAGLLLPIEVIVDDAARTDDDDLTTNLVDWPESGFNLRSPKHLFAKDDNIFVRVRGPHGMGDNKIKVKVTSESDTTGITFDLAEISPGVFINKSPAKPLRLSETTEAKSDCITIKVIDEEVLTFNLVFDGTDIGKFTDVMVDRGEFASCGINVFYGSSTGDRSTVRTQAITNTKLFDAGDGNYPDNVTASGNAMLEFAQNVGADQTYNRQADMLHISAHGADDGKIYDHSGIQELPVPIGGVAIDPVSVGGYWNVDVEWIILATCSQLNVAGGGRAAWEPTLNGSPRRAHAILGAHKPLAGDLRSEFDAFWVDIRDNQEVIIDAYANAMGSGASPQPWAYLANSANTQDKLKTVTRDDASGTITFSYLDASGICSRAENSEDGIITQVIDGGNGLLRVEVPSVSGKRLRKPFKLLPPQDLSKSKLISFAKKVTRSPHGRHDFTGRSVTETAHERTTLNNDQAAELATAYLQNNFPEFASRARVKEVSSRVSGMWLENGGENAWTNGYLVQFSILNGDIPIWGSFVNITINGNRIDGISFCVHQETAQAKAAINSTNASEPVDVRIGLNKILPRLKQRLGIKGKYEVLKAELCYVNQADARGEESNLNDEFIPAYHLVINKSYDGPGSMRKLFHVWLDANTGELIGEKSY